MLEYSTKTPFVLVVGEGVRARRNDKFHYIIIRLTSDRHSVIATTLPTRTRLQHGIIADAQAPFLLSL